MSKIQIGLSYKCERKAEKKEGVDKQWKRPLEKFEFFLCKTVPQSVWKRLLYGRISYT
jgi:hypothetical protein